MTFRYRYNLTHPPPPPQCRIKIQNLAFIKMHLNISSVKCRPFCPGGGGGCLMNLLIRPMSEGRLFMGLSASMNNIIWPFTCWYFRNNTRIPLLFLSFVDGEMGLVVQTVFLVYDKEPYTIYGQYHTWWWPSNKRQNINICDHVKYKTIQLVKVYEHTGDALRIYAWGRVIIRDSLLLRCLIWKSL